MRGKGEVRGLGVHLFINAMQEFLHLSLNEFGGLWLVGQPDEGDVHRGCRGWEDVVVQAPGFTDLALGSIAVDGMLEVAFADRRHHA